MFLKTLFLFLGYVVNIFSTAKENHSQFHYKNMRMKTSCNFCTSANLTNHFSYENIFNDDISLQIKRKQQNNEICNGATFKSIYRMMTDVLETNHSNRVFIANASSSALIKSEVIKNSGSEAFDGEYFSRNRLTGFSPVVENTNVNALKSLFSNTTCVKLKEKVTSLFKGSDTLLEYIGNRNISIEIILHRTSARISDQKIFDNISNVSNTFNVIEETLSNCILTKGKETTILTKSSFLWCKVDEPSRFQNLPHVFQKRCRSFVNITSELQKDLAEKPGLISVLFMTNENLIRFSYKNFISVSQLMFLSIKRKGKHLKNLSTPVDLFFKYKIDATSEQLFQGTTHIPPDFASLLDKDELVSVYKLMPFHFPGSGKILITFYNLSTNSLNVTISINIRPDWITMALNSTTISSKSLVYEIVLENQTKESINYLGITSANTIPGTIDYNFEIRYFQCYSMFGMEWKSYGCDVGVQTNETIVHCRCQHLSLFGGGVAIAPRQVDIKKDIKYLFLINENPRPCILVCSIILIYLMILVWTRHNDSKDRLQRFVVVLDDNFPGEEWPYLLTVYTSFWIGSGTEAKVGIRLYGTKGISRIHILYKKGQRKLLKTNCDDWFLIFTPKNLGQIKKIHIFSDFSGGHPDWYCRKMMLYDLEGQREFKFIIEKWVSLAEEDECVDFFCYPTPTKKSLRRDRIAMDNILFGIQETHLLFSIFTRHPRSSVTRSQRLSVCICILLVHLLTSNIFHESEFPDSPQYSETKRKLVIQMESTLVASPFTFIIIFCFKKSRIITAPKNNIPMTLTSTQAVPLETGLEINQSRRKPISQSSENLAAKENQPIEPTPLYESSEDEETEEDTDDEELEEEEVEEEQEKEIEEGCLKNCYNQIRALVFQVILSKTVMPVKIAEEDEKSSRIRLKWMYFAWLLCESAIFGSGFFIIVYSLKMDHDICSEWMLSSMKYSLTNIFFMAPLKITVFALILAGLYGQLHYIPSYECNTEAAVKRKRIGNKKFLSRLLTIRKHKYYKPLNSKKTQAIRLKQKNWRRWKILTNFIVMVVLYVLLMIIIESSWHGLYVESREHYRKMFDPSLNSGPITNFKTYIHYLMKVVIPAYDKVKWYNGVPIMTEEIWKQETGFLKDYNNRIVGIPRLRQQRVKPDSCVFPPIMSEKLESQQCFASINWSNLDKKSYSVSWTKPEKLVEDSSSPWVFSDHGNTPVVTCGHRTGKCYMSGGYTAKLSLKEKKSKNIVDRLIKDEWFDGLSRVLFFETVVYNANTNILSSVVPMMEKLADGNMLIHIKTFSLHPKSTDYLVTLLCLLVFNFYYCIRIVLLFNRKGLKYLLSGTGILDIFISMMLYASMVSVLFNRSARLEYLRTWQLQEENDLQITKNIFLHKSLLQYETAMILVLISLQLLRNFRFGKKFFVCFKTLSYCTKYSIGIALIIAIFYTFLAMLSSITISKPAQCLYNRCYNHVTYCTGIYALSYDIDFFSLIFWLMSNIATFFTCVTTMYGYKWMKEQNKYVKEFDIASFLLEKLSQGRKNMIKVLFHAKREVNNLSPLRMRAGADTIEELEEDIYPINKSLTCTRTMLDEMNIKFDTVLEKLEDLNKSI